MEGSNKEKSKVNWFILLFLLKKELPDVRNKCE